MSTTRKRAVNGSTGGVPGGLGADALCVPNGKTDRRRSSSPKVSALSDHQKVCTRVFVVMDGHSL